MTMMITLVLRVKDWPALHHTNRAALVGRAREAGAFRYRLLRDARDASQVLLVVELPDDQSAQDFEQDIAAALDALPGGRATSDRLWETTELDGIG